MVRCAYRCCPRLYEDYYNQQHQTGHGLPVFVGSGGLGSVLSGIGRSLIPLFQRGGKALLREGARTGLQVVSDVASGKSAEASLKRRSGEAGERLLKRIKTSRAVAGRQTGRGTPKTKKKKTTTTTKKKMKKKKKNEIKKKKEMMKRRKKIKTNK